MNTQMKPETLAAYKIYFKKCDENGDGKLNFKELSDMYAKIYEKPPTGYNLRTAFDQFDRDGNNKIDFEEFLNIAPELPTIEDLFRAEFNKHDCSKDGLINKRELQFAMMSLGQFVVSSEAQKIIDEVDADNDGNLNIEEFIKLIPKLYK